MLAEGCEKCGGERDGGLVFGQQQEAFAELDDEAGTVLTREVDSDEAEVGAGKPTRCSERGLDIQERMQSQRRIGRGWILGRLP